MTTAPQTRRAFVSFASAPLRLDPPKSEPAVLAPHVPHVRSSNSDSASVGLSVDLDKSAVQVVKGVFSRSVVGQAEVSRSDLREALDSNAYGALTLNGFTPGRISKLHDSLVLGSQLASTGALVGLAGVSSLVNPACQGVGTAVLFVGAAVAYIADLAKKDAISRHAALSRAVGATREGSAPAAALVNEVIKYTGAPLPRLLRSFSI